MPALLLASLLAATWSPPTDASLDALVHAVRSAPLAERIERVSARFVGAPYRLGPLGEGAGHAPDPDPLWRWDAVDCVTFVEQVLALAESQSLGEAKHTLQRIRYAHGEVDYRDRNHLMEPAWIPNNTRKGFIAPSSKAVAGHDVRYLWRRAPPRAGLTREVALPYLPLRVALAHQDQIPSGTIFFVAREWWHEVPDHVTHLGLLIRKDGKLYARHASSDHHRVIDVPFARFLRHESRALPQYPVLGLELALPLDTGER